MTLVGSFDYCRVRLILILSSPHNLEHVAELCIKMEPSTVLDDGTKYSRHVVDVLRLSLTLVSRYLRYGTAVHSVVDSDHVGTFRCSRIQLRDRKFFIPGEHHVNTKRISL